jgi:hypothetical protein
MEFSRLGYALCGAVVAALAIAILPSTLSEAAGLSEGTALAFLALVGGTLLLAGAAWGTAFREH